MKIKNVLAVFALGLCSTAWIACNVEDPGVDETTEGDAAAGVDEETGQATEALCKNYYYLWDCPDAGNNRLYEGKTECNNVCVKACVGKRFCE